ncbi:YolD-like family protein [Paenibacillus sinopodophylli]|uniref:YolD-like family protein n=1 Tax=Paenibacillus sinopodophylli TaxID=1837342 RepID=UPI00110D11FE|nr:YolD-like family protein [Paenibacillus sinopodophylli]
MLPEHVVAINKYNEELRDLDMAKAKGPKRPTRDEFELEELGERLVEAQQEDLEISLIVWNWDQRVTGKITKMDSRTKMVHVYDNGEEVKVPFLDIMKVVSSD